MGMSQRWVARYRRQITLQGFGLAAQERLAAAHVLVVGAGGLGSPALLYLAGAGVGKITVCDDDVVALSNLHRQVIHSEAAVGMPKVDSAAAQLRERNSDIEVLAVGHAITEDNAPELFDGVDVVVDGTDNFAARYIVSRACARRGIPHVWGSILGVDAQCSVFWSGHGTVYEDVFPTPPPAGSVPSCAEGGVLGPVVGVVGTTMALETVKLLSGVGEPMLGRIAYFDGLSGTWEYIPLATPGDGESTAPAGKLASILRDEAASEHVLIDVREPEEYATFHLPGARNLPLSQLRSEISAELVTELNQASAPVVVYCAAGRRSTEAIELLTRAGASGLNNLDGGLEAWFERAEDQPSDPE